MTLRPVCQPEQAGRLFHGPHAPASIVAALIVIVLVHLLSATALAQDRRPIDDPDMASRPVTEIRFVGLDRVSPTLVRNQLRTAIGDPFDPKAVQGDITRLTRLGEFKTPTAFAELKDDGTVAVIFQFDEQPIIREIRIEGNTVVADRDVRPLIRLAPGSPRDDFVIDEAIRRIEDLYRERGHFITAVAIDETALRDEGILIFRIVEGPRVRIQEIKFDGNERLADRNLYPEIETRTAIPFIRRGQLDEQQLAADVAAIDTYYKDRGYLDVRVDRQVDMSPDGKEAVVTFIVDEGPQYRLRSIIARRITMTGREALRVFSTDQIAAMIEIKTGDVYSQDRVRKSVEIIRRAYQHMGYVDVRVNHYDLRTGDDPTVDLVFEIDEGTYTRTGVVSIAGNFLTRDRVIRRHLGNIQPGRPLDESELEEARRRIVDTRLFNDVRITIQDPEPGAPDDGPTYRDVLVEIKERNTGAVTFGAAVGSDAGVTGQIAISQDNFDIQDWPDSVGEVITGRAFRGAGQKFNMAVEPGNRVSVYSVGFTEPYLFDSDTSMQISGFVRDRVFRQYDEDRSSVSLSFGRRFGEIWTASISSRFERVELNDIDPAAPTAVFDSQGPDSITSLGVNLTRSTIGTIQRPGRGSRLELGVEQIGLLGGDYGFTKTSLDYTTFFTLDEDFLGRKTTLRLNTRAAYLFGGSSPIYERYFLGGRTLRGLSFREVSPKGIRADNGEPSNEPIGGEWMFFLGAQYEMPLVQEFVSGALFVDSGTVTASPGFDDYRVSIGAGLRLYIPQFGPIPIAFDFAVPLRKEDRDRSQIFSFSAEIPF